MDTGPSESQLQGETEGKQGRGWRRDRAGERLEESRGEAGGEEGRGWRNLGSPSVCLTFLTQASVQLSFTVS